VPISQNTIIRVRREIRLKPLSLRRSCATPADIGTVGIQRDEVPGADVETVVTLAGLTGGGAEVVEVAGGAGIRAGAVGAAGGKVFVVADDRVGQGLDTTPTQVVRL